MELLLNILWLGISLALILLVGRERTARSGSCAKLLIAAALVVVFLFPAISITDDLHVEAMAVDEPGWRSYCGSAQFQHSTVALVWTPAALTTFDLRKESRGFVSLATAPSARAGFKSSSSLRAPPSSLLS